MYKEKMLDRAFHFTQEFSVTRSMIVSILGFTRLTQISAQHVRHWRIKYFERRDTTKKASLNIDLKVHKRKAKVFTYLLNNLTLRFRLLLAKEAKDGTEG